MLIMLLLLIRGCNITASAYNAAAPRAANATTTNATILIRRRCSNAYNATMLISSGVLIIRCENAI